MIQVFDQIGPLGLTYRSWKQMQDDVDDLSTYFTGLWLPPASASTGNPGYLPVSYTDFHSFYGSEQDFRELVGTLRSKQMDAMADVVFHHMLGTDKDKWFQLNISTSTPLEQPKDYLPLWQWNDNFGNSYQRTDRKKEEIIDPNNSQQDCLGKTNDNWKVNENCVPEASKADCNKVAPMYTIDPKVMDAGNLSALNLCQIDILRNQIGYLKQLKQFGINAFRYDQGNGIPPGVFQLYNNSNPGKTRNILNKIADHCQTSRMYQNCPQVYKNQIEDQIKALPDDRLEEFTGPSHDLAVAECFTYNVEINYAYDYPTHQWWALVPMLRNMNEGLDQNDKIGVFDFALHRVLYTTFGSDINSSKQPLCVNGSGFQNSVYFPNITIDSNFWYQAFSTGFPTSAQGKTAYNVPLVKYNKQEFCTKEPCQVYTFVSNHDNDGIMKDYSYTQQGRGFQDEGFVSYSRIVLAYFIILMMPGIPVVFGLHFHWFQEIRLFLLLRDALGITFDSTLDVNPNDNPGNYGRVTWTITTPEKKTFTFAIIDTINKYKEDNSIFNLKKIFETPMYQSWADPSKNAPILLQVYEGSGPALK